MATTNYHTLNGRIRGETTSGVRTNYLTDALGSVTATANSSGTVVNTYRYKPHGTLLTKTGVGADPRFGWTGDTGSRITSNTPFLHYNRARHYQVLIGLWISKDPADFIHSSYVYAISNPILYVDPSGLYHREWKKVCGVRAFVVTTNVQDAHSIASGLNKRPKRATLSGREAIGYCKSVYRQFTGRAIVVNGTLFNDGDGRGDGLPNGPVKDCRGYKTSGIGSGELERSTELRFGSGIVWPRRAFKSTGECWKANFLSQGWWKDPKPATILRKSSSSLQLYVFPTPGIKGSDVCNCFPQAFGIQTLLLDGGGSTQAYEQLDDQAPIVNIVFSSRAVNNFFWIRERGPRPDPEPAPDPDD